MNVTSSSTIRTELHMLLKASIVKRFDFTYELQLHGAGLIELQHGDRGVYVSPTENPSSD